jgi:hypothetical protein
VRLLLAAVAAAVLAVVAGTVWLGARVREDTVVAHPYEQGLAYDAQRHARLAGEVPGVAAGPTPARCDLGEGSCTREAVTLELGPRPLRTMRELAVSVALAAGAPPPEEVTVSFAMPGMDMGENTARLAAAGGGRFQGKAVLVRCPGGRRDWVATVRVRRAGAAAALPFPLRVEE